MQMNTFIEIHDSDTINTGYYDVWYKVGNQKHKRRLSENYVNALLEFDQKERFFMGQYRFKINEYDFKTLIIEGQSRQGLGD